ncbi:MAG: Gfo/Idh/MocA family oxidoreductase, partial [Roseovarius sp.]|nr:Gfo/Idh/MocA family oxidoreductase [Roseovarius sp.]
MKQIRTGVVGVGHLGYHHARIYTALDGVELIGIVDTDSVQAQKSASDFNTRAFDSVEALIEAGVDAVSVAVPTSFHLDIASRLLAAGVDVLVEKPLAGSVEEGRALVATARKHGRLLQVGHIERFNG